MDPRERIFYRGAVCILTILYYLAATVPFWRPESSPYLFSLAFLLYYTLLTVLGTWSVRRSGQGGTVLWLVLGIPILLSLAAGAVALLCYPLIPDWDTLNGTPLIHHFQSAPLLLLRGYAWGGWVVTFLAVSRCLQVRPVYQAASYL